MCCNLLSWFAPIFFHRAPFRGHRWRNSFLFAKIGPGMPTYMAPAPPAPPVLFATPANSQKSFYSEKRLHRKASTHSKNLKSTEKPLHTAGFHTQQAFTHQSFYLHTGASIYTRKLSHAANIYTQKGSFYTEKLWPADLLKGMRDRA